MAIVSSKEGATFIFGSWVCDANGQGGFNSHLANPKGLEASMLAAGQDMDTPADGLGKTQLCDPIGSCTSHLSAIPHPPINA
jgi:hypothetical protein